MNREELVNYLADLNPDTLWSDDGESVTFAFQNGKYIEYPGGFDNHGIVHTSLLVRHGWTRREPDRDEMVHQGMILGRYGTEFHYGAQVVAFWNGKSANRQIKECLSYQLKKKKISPFYYVVAPGYKIEKVWEFLGMSTPTSGLKPTPSGGGWKPNKPTPPPIEQKPEGPVKPEFSPELLRKMHLMPGEVKKQVMAQAGVGAKKTIDYEKPGLKWWAPHSEQTISFRDWLRD